MFFSNCWRLHVVHGFSLPASMRYESLVSLLFVSPLAFHVIAVLCAFSQNTHNIYIYIYIYIYIERRGGGSICSTNLHHDFFLKQNLWIFDVSSTLTATSASFVHPQLHPHIHLHLFHLSFPGFFHKLCQTFDVFFDLNLCTGFMCHLFVCFFDASGMFGVLIFLPTSDVQVCVYLSLCTLALTYRPMSLILRRMCRIRLICVFVLCNCFCMRASLYVPTYVCMWGCEEARTPFPWVGRVWSDAPRQVQNGPKLPALRLAPSSQRHHTVTCVLSLLSPIVCEVCVSLEVGIVSRIVLNSVLQTATDWASNALETLIGDTDFLGSCKF